MKKLIVTTLGLIMATSIGVSSAFALAIPTYHDYTQKGKTGVTVEYLDENDDSLYVDIDFQPRVDGGDADFLDSNQNGVIDEGDTVTFTITVSDDVPN